MVVGIIIVLGVVGGDGPLMLCVMLGGGSVVIRVVYLEIIVSSVKKGK